MGLYRAEGVVLRTWRLGEADRIVVVLTGGRGKVRAVAKGVRKTASRFGGRLEPAGHVALLCHEGRELDVVTQAETIESFPELRSDLARMRDALALLEAADQVSREGQADERLLAMLVGALRTVAHRPAALVVAGFYWKLLALEGSAPDLSRCVRCGTDDASVLAGMHPVEGGALCRACRPAAPGAVAASPEAVGLCRTILAGGLAPALATPPGPLAAEVADLATRALEAHLERRLRVPRLLERG